MPFCFLEVPFYFWKMPSCFPELPSRSAFFNFLCASFFKNAFFPAHCTFSSSCQNCSERYLPCSCYISSWNSLLTNLWCLLHNVETSIWSMIFHVFCSNFSLYDSLKNAVSEHLEWLKFQKYRGRGLQCPLDPPGVLHTA